jgi:hypothetical protein
MKDYTLFIKNNIYHEINNNNKFDYVHFASVTKFIVLLGFLDCIEKHNISYNDKIKKIFPKYIYNYTFLDIINHNTIINNEWTPSSELKKKYFKSKNIYDYVLKIENNDTLKKGFNYSNYTYDILAYTVYKLEKMYIDKYLEQTILKNVKYKWTKINKKPIASWGLFIHTKTFKIFAENLLSILQFKNLDFFWNNNDYITIKSKKYYLIGHDGSGGQYLYYNLKLNTILFWFSYNNTDEKIRTWKKYNDIFIKLFNSLN